jgi:hypothetical protein
MMLRHRSKSAACPPGRTADGCNTPGRLHISAEGAGGRGDDLVVRDVSHVVRDIPSVPEGVLELAVAVAPEHVLDRLPDRRTGGHSLREDGVGVGDVECQHHGCPADRRRCENAQLRELVGDVQDVAADAQLQRHETPVGRRDTADLLGAERVTVELAGALGALDDDVSSKSHASDGNGGASSGS